jgi:hypothetical protein
MIRIDQYWNIRTYASMKMYRTVPPPRKLVADRHAGRSKPFSLQIAETEPLLLLNLNTVTLKEQVGESLFVFLVSHIFWSLQRALTTIHCRHGR